MQINNLINQGIDEALKKDKKNILLGEDIKDPYGGAFKVTENLSSKYPKQVYQMPVSEAGFVGVATGMAYKGYNPIVEIMFCDFITLIADVLINTTSKLAQLNKNKMQGKVLIRTPSGGKRGYGPIHSQSLEKLFFGWPEISVFALNTFYSPKKLFRDVFLNNSKVKLLIEHKTDYTKHLYDEKEIINKGFRLEMIKEKIPISIIKNHTDNISPDVVFCCYGGVAPEVFEAAYSLMIEEEISSSIYIPTKISPIDTELINHMSKLSPKKIVIVEDGHSKCGWGSHLITKLSEMNIDLKLNNIKILGSKHHMVPANFNEEKDFFPNKFSIYNNTLNIL